jgi:predicted transcriptional regulator
MESINDFFANEKQTLESRSKKGDLMDWAMMQPKTPLENEESLKLEREILRAITTSRFLRKELSQISRWYQIPLEIVESMANQVGRDNGLDLEHCEFNSVCRQVKEIETIADAGYRDWRLQCLARQHKRTKKELMEAYRKAAINQIPITPKTLKQMRESAPSQVRWLVQGWIPAGVSLLLHAHGGVGKTLFLYEIATAIAKGQTWNGYPCTMGEVLVLQSDEPEHISRERLEICGAPDDSQGFTVFRDWQVESIPQLEAYLQARSNANSPVRFVLVDSITSINGNTAESENDIEYARFVQEFNRMAEKFGCTFAIVHHSSRNGNARGTTAIHNAVSEVWAMSVYNEMTGQRLLRVQKNRAGRAVGRYLLDFDPETYKFTYTGDEDDINGSKLSLEKRLEAWFNEESHWGTRYESEEIAEAILAPKDSIRRGLYELWSKGIIKRDVENIGQKGRQYLYYSEVDQSKRVINLQDDEAARVSEVDQCDRDLLFKPLLYGECNGVINLTHPPQSHKGEIPEVDHYDRSTSGDQADQGGTDQPKNTPTVGQAVLVTATATWHKNGSDKLPWFNVPRNLRGQKTISLGALSGELFNQLIGKSLVLSITNEKARVRNLETGRTSVFLLSDLRVLE